MMQEFPKINAGQIVVLRAERATGHVLDEQYLVAVNDSQIVYTIFEDIHEAIIYAKETALFRRDVEFVLYDHSDKYLETIDAT